MVSMEKSPGEGWKTVWFKMWSTLTSESSGKKGYTMHLILVRELKWMTGTVAIQQPFGCLMMFWCDKIRKHAICSRGCRVVMKQSVLGSRNFQSWASNIVAISLNMASVLCSCSTCTNAMENGDPLYDVNLESKVTCRKMSPPRGYRIPPSLARRGGTAQGMNPHLCPKVANRPVFS